MFTVAIYAACAAVLIWAFWPSPEKRREYGFKWKTIQDVSQPDCVPRWCEFGPLGETNIHYGEDAETTGPR